MSSYEYQPLKKSQKRTLCKKLKSIKNAPKNIFLFKIWMFSNVIDLLKYYVVKNFFYLFLIFCPLEFLENITLKWVAFIGF